APAPRPPQLTFTQKTALVDRMLGCAAILDPKKRAAVVSQLRPDIALNIQQTDVAKFDALQILNTCLNYSGGLDELLGIIRWTEGDSIPARALEAAVQEVVPAR